MDKNSTLEVTNAFPFPAIELPQADGHHDNNAAQNLAAAAPRAKSNTTYQSEMIKKLREVNVDANNVGWYTSANLGNFVTPVFIENQYHYQKELNERTVALVHDTSRSTQGSLSLHAFRLSPAFMTAFRDNKFTAERCDHSVIDYFDLLANIVSTQSNQVRPSLSGYSSRASSSNTQLSPPHLLPSLPPKSGTLCRSAARSAAYAGSSCGHARPIISKLQFSQPFHRSIPHADHRSVTRQHRNSPHRAEQLPILSAATCT